MRLFYFIADHNNPPLGSSDELVRFYSNLLIKYIRYYHNIPVALKLTAAQQKCVFDYFDIHMENLAEANLMYRKHYSRQIGGNITRNQREKPTDVPGKHNEKIKISRRCCSIYTNNKNHGSNSEISRVYHHTTAPGDLYRVCLKLMTVPSDGLSCITAIFHHMDKMGIKAIQSDRQLCDFVLSAISVSQEYVRSDDNHLIMNFSDLAYILLTDTRYQSIKPGKLWDKMKYSTDFWNDFQDDEDVTLRPRAVEFSSEDKRYRIESANFPKTEPKKLRTPRSEEERNTIPIEAGGEKNTYANELKLGKEKNEAQNLWRTTAEKFMNDPAAVRDARQRLDAELESSKIQSENAEAKVMELLALNDEAQAQLLEAKIAGQTLAPFSLQEAIYFYLTGDYTELSAHYNFSEQHAEALRSAVHQYLLHNTEYQKNLRALQALNEWSDAPSSLAFQHRAYSALKAKRAYDVAKHPEYLVFEQADNKLLRPDQVASLSVLMRQASSGWYDSQILQAIMGAGKTKLLFPLLAVLAASKGRLSVVIVPQGMFQTNLIDFKKLIKRVFNRSVYPFRFSRDLPLNEKSLQVMYTRLKDAVSSGNYVMTTAEDVQALELHYLDLMLSQAVCDHETDLEIPKNDMQNIKIAQDILELLEKQSDALFDEIDSVLNIQYELNYALGHKKHLLTKQREEITRLYLLMTRVDAQGVSLYHRISAGADFNTYDTADITHRLALIVVGECRQGGIYDIGVNLDNKEAALFAQYLCGKTKSIPDFVARCDASEKETIGLIRLQLNQLLDYSLKRKFNQHYGFSRSRDKSKVQQATSLPYIGNNTAKEGSEFFSYFETINYTILGNLQQTLSDDLLDIFFTKYLNRYNNEMTNLAFTFNSGVSTSAREFNALIPLNMRGRLSFEKMSEMQRADRLLALRQLSEDPEFKLEIIDDIILKDITYFSEVLRSNSLNHGGMYHTKRGMSGTPYNYTTQPDDITFNELMSRGIDGITMDMLIRKQTPLRTVGKVVSVDSLKDWFTQDADPARVRQLVDVGAFFRGIDNINVARMLAQYFKTDDTFSDILYIMFFNEDNVLCALSVANPNNIIIIGSTKKDDIQKATGCSPDNCFSYYDQVHTTGVDLPAGSQDRALVTASLDTTLRSLLQGVMRMRQFSEEQSVSVLMDTEVSHINNIDELLQHCYNIQADEVSEHTLQAAVMKIDNWIRGYILDLIKNTADLNRKVRIINHFRKHFVTQVDTDLFKKYGSCLHEIPTETFLKRYANQQLNNFTEEIASSKLADVDITTLKSTAYEVFNSIIERALPHCKPTAYANQGEPKNQSMVVDANASVEQGEEANISKQQQRDRRVMGSQIVSNPE